MTSSSASAHFFLKRMVWKLLFNGTLEVCLWDIIPLLPSKTSIFVLVQQKITKNKNLCHSGFCWQYNSFSDLSSSIRALFCVSKTATRLSRHLMYSFFFLRHSRAASLKTKFFNLIKSELQRLTKIKCT